MLAIYGEWGEGKTSVLEMIKTRLDTNSSIDGKPIVLEFNPWMFSGPEQLVALFLTSLAAEVNVKLRRGGEQLGERLREYAGMFALVPSGLLAGADPSKALQAIGNKLKAPSLEVQRQRIDDAIRDAGVRPVVFIDDIDRLDADEIRVMVKLVKLVGGFGNTTYVLAFDDAVVAAALSVRQSDNPYADGQHYLEKIVQVPLRLPTADERTVLSATLRGAEQALTDVGIEVPEHRARPFASRFEALFLAKPRTLRLGKQWINAILFALPLLRGEADASDLLLLEALRTFYPDVYRKLRGARGVLLGEDISLLPEGTQVATERAKVQWHLWGALFVSLPERERRAVDGCLRYLFPMVLQMLDRVNYSVDDQLLWEREQRIGSTRYFDRYFQLAVPPHDISDLAVSRFEAVLEAGDLKGAVSTFRELGSRSMERLLPKLRQRVERYPEAAATTLLRVLAECAELFPSADGFLAAFLSPRPQAAFLAADALRRIGLAVEREARALRLVERATAVPFAVECARAILTSDEPSDSTQEARPVLPPSGEEAVRKAICARLTAAEQVQPFYDAPDTDRQLLLWAWQRYCGRDATSAVLTKRFTTDPTSAVKLLLAYARQGWSTTGRFEKPMERDGYDAVLRLVDEDTVLTALRVVYGDALDASTSADDGVNNLGNDAVARRFFYLSKLARQGQG